MHAIIYSKDRPWQLSECLRSLFAKNRFLFDHSGNVRVLIKSSPEYLDAYFDLQKRFPLVRFYFQSRVLSCWDFFKDSVNAAGCDRILLAVDDTIFIKDFSNIPLIYQDNPFLVYSLRLGNNISYCQPARQPSSNYGKVSLGNKQFMIPYAMYNGDTYDFAYPFDLSASVYTAVYLQWFIKHVEAVFNIEQRAAMIPNDIEAAYYQMTPDISYKTHIAYADEPYAKVLTINRVQDAYQNPVDVEVTCKELLDYYNRGVQLDLLKYENENKNFKSIHISEVYLK